MHFKKPRKNKLTRKTSVIKCINCNKNQKVTRTDAKYCSDLCKKRESLFRIEKGYTFKIGKELNNDLIAFYNERPFQLHPNPFTKEIKVLIGTKKPDQMTLPWKYEFNNFILYYFPHLKKNKFNLFYNEKSKKTWEHYLKMSKILD